MFALLAAVLSAGDTTLSKALLQKTTPHAYLSWFFTIATPLLAPVAFMYREQLSWSLLAWSLLLGLLSYAANTLYFTGLQEGEVSQVAPLRAVAVLITVLLATFLYANERFTPPAYAGVALIIASILLVNLNLTKGASFTLDSKAVKNVLAAMLFWGLLYALVKTPLATGVNPFLLYWLVGLVFLTILASTKRITPLPLTERVRVGTHTLSFTTLFAAITLTVITEYFLLYTALSHMTTVSILCYNLDTLFMVVAAALLFKERVPTTRRYAVVTAVAGVLLLQLFI